MAVSLVAVPETISSDNVKLNERVRYEITKAAKGSAIGQFPNVRPTPAKPSGGWRLLFQGTASGRPFLFALLEGRVESHAGGK
jgi:hypothetical protein